MGATVAGSGGGHIFWWAQKVKGSWKYNLLGGTLDGGKGQDTWFVPSPSPSHFVIGRGTPGVELDKRSMFILTSITLGKLGGMGPFGSLWAPWGGVCSSRVK